MIGKHEVRLARIDGLGEGEAADRTEIPYLEWGIRRLFVALLGVGGATVGSWVSDDHEPRRTAAGPLSSLSQHARGGPLPRSSLIRAPHPERDLDPDLPAASHGVRGRGWIRARVEDAVLAASRPISIGRAPDPEPEHGPLGGLDPERGAPVVIQREGGAVVAGEDNQRTRLAFGWGSRVPQPPASVHLLEVLGGEQEDVDAPAAGWGSGWWHLVPLLLTGQPGIVGGRHLDLGTLLARSRVQAAGPREEKESKQDPPSVDPVSRAHGLPC